MSCATVRGLVRARLPRHDDDRGSIPFLLLVMIVTIALGGLLLKTIVDQARTSNFDQSRARSLTAAQSGIDYVLGQIRTGVSVADVTNGDAGKLPCGPWTDVAADTAAAGSFDVSVAYYTTNPVVMTDSERSSNKMVCSAAAGPYDPTARSRTPRFAVITSTGVDDSVNGNGSSKGRTVETTYVFQTNDVNISGGQLRLFPTAGSTANWCMDVGSTPAVGTAVTLQPCSTTNPPASQQIFSYRADLSIELVSSSAPPAAGLCLDTANPTTHASGLAIVLKQCSVADEAVSQPSATFVCPSGYSASTFASAYPGRNCAVSPYNQQWSVDDNAHLRGALQDQTNVDGYCIDAASQAAGTALLLQSCTGGTTDSRQTWIPSPTTGAGMAGAGNQQLVNYYQFATCLDVTGQDVNAAFLIAYTCKQNPNPSKVAWNQKFAPSPALTKAPTTTLLTTSAGGTTYCLRAPLQSGGFPVLSSSCPASATAAGSDNFRWTVYQRYATAATDATELAYADRYTIKDSSGRCLDLGPNNDLLNGAYYKITTEQCDGSTGQKWNADPSKLKASLTNTRELTTSGG